LNADLWSIALELLKSLKEREIVMTLIDTDVQIIDMFPIVLHGSFIEKMTVCGEKQVEWFLMGVLQDLPKVLSYERVTSFKAQDDDA
jgi:hypothetical protein